MKIKLYESLGHKEIKRPYRNPCLVCGEMFSVGDKYINASHDTFIKGLKIESFIRVHIDCGRRALSGEVDNEHGTYRRCN